MGQDYQGNCIILFVKEKLAALLNNSVGFSINLFIFEISMDLLTLQMNTYMFEFMYDAECSEILVSKLFPNDGLSISNHPFSNSDASRAIIGLKEKFRRTFCGSIQGIRFRRPL